VAFSDSHIGETRGDGVNGSPDLSEGEVLSGGGIDEGGGSMVGSGGDECRDV
jgi:hypothetical protein